MTLNRRNTTAGNAVVPTPTTPSLGQRRKTLPADFTQKPPVILIEFDSPAISFQKSCVCPAAIEEEARAEKELYAMLPPPFSNARVSFELPSGSFKEVF
jgi:hypothetical protein